MRKWFTVSLLAFFVVVAPLFGSITETSNTIREAGNDVKTEFEFPFRIFAETDLDVYKLDEDDDSGSVLVLNTDYTVDFTAGEEGGSVTYTVAPTSDQDSFIARILDITQPNTFPVEEGLSEGTLEDTVDRLTMVCQQIQETVDRAAVIPLTSSDTTVEDVLQTALDNTATAATSAATAVAAAASVAEPTRVQARLSTDQTGIVTATPTKLLFDAVPVNVGSLWASNTFTANAAMTVHVDLIAHIIALADAKYFRVMIYKNGTVAYFNTAHASVAADLGCMVSADIPLVNTDTLEAYVYHNNGSNRDIDGSSGFRTSISIRKVAST